MTDTTTTYRVDLDRAEPTGPLRDQAVATVLAAAFDAMPADLRPAELVNRDRAARALAALAKAGMTVALPQEPARTVPSAPDEHGLQDWVTPIGEVTVFDDGEARIDSTYHSALAPAELRAFADILYSAAAYADTIVEA